MKAFDRKFGPEFVSGLPLSPGIYRVFNPGGELIYVGKAKNLRRRISQYRNAKRRKKHHKMRAIVKEADRIEIEIHPTELDACLAEARVIQKLRPKWNVAGAFYFLYPLIGIARDGELLKLLYTTDPDALPPSFLSGYSMHGAFRSRFLCGNAFFALMELLGLIGHKNRALKPSKHSYAYSFRQIDRHWPGCAEDLEKLFRGDSAQAFEMLVLGLVENASARRNPKKIQRLLNDVKRFWKHEALVLRRARLRSGISEYPIPQKQRDFVFLESRYGEHSSSRSRPAERSR